MTAVTTSDDGFTLLEVVLAVALLAFAAAIVFPIFGQAPHRILAISERQQAQQLGNSLFDELVAVGNWQAMPNSAAAAEWIAIAGTEWEWRAFEVPNQDSSAFIIPGRPLHIAIDIKRSGAEGALHSLEEVVWIGGDG